MRCHLGSAPGSIHIAANRIICFLPEAQEEYPQHHPHLWIRLTYARLVDLCYADADLHHDTVTSSSQVLLYTRGERVDECR